MSTPVTPRLAHGDVKDSQADITRARELLGYQPLVSFEEGLRRTLEWYRTEASGRGADMNTAKSGCWDSSVSRALAITAVSLLAVPRLRRRPPILPTSQRDCGSTSRRATAARVTGGRPTA